ncbi:unnamed protein product, partial [Heligmosomoides polygyrus]|uniref:ACB domain-containing protein n=1 Tax=Heligmosomoides polygyrus TaxID=6339 RepID=A0A183FWD1_HELPZ
ARSAWRVLVRNCYPLCILFRNVTRLSQLLIIEKMKNKPIGNNMAVQVLKHEYELLIRFEEEAYDLWGLYQQAVVGNVNVPKLDYMDPVEESWMWSWIKGNKKWHSWNRCKGKHWSFVLCARENNGVRPSDAQQLDDQDPRIPDRNRYVPEEEREEVDRITREAKSARR